MCFQSEVGLTLFTQLPEFASTLDQHEQDIFEGDETIVKSPASEGTPPPVDAQLRSPKGTRSKLRYDAYESPKPTPRLRRGNQAALEARPLNPRSASDTTADREGVNGARNAFLSEDGSTAEHATSNGELIEMYPLSPVRPVSFQRLDFASWI